jgi:hypothetical protein
LSFVEFPQGEITNEDRGCSAGGLRPIWNLDVMDAILFLVFFSNSYILQFLSG